MNDETLKEQIKEIRKYLKSEFSGEIYVKASDIDEEVSIEYKPTKKVLDRTMIVIEKLILQDRERAVREARIDELEKITDHYTPYRPFLDDDKNVNIRRYCTDRLAELSNPTQEKNI